MIRATVNRTAVVAAAALVLLVGAAGAHASATIVIQNVDGAGEGFNDPTAFAPVGGNPAVTLGQARLNAFQYAASLWGDCINSNVIVTVQAKMDPQFCDATSAVLGSAGATTIHANFTNAPAVNVWYCQALANSHAGVDLAIGTPDISSTFNSNINGQAGCLGGWSWYYGYDGLPAANQIDFVSVVLHEIGHGLGFQTFHNLTTGAYAGPPGGPFYPDTYLLQLDRNGAVPSAYPAMTNAQRSAANKADPNTRWMGASVQAAQLLIPVTAGLAGARVRVHAPAALSLGSSISHWSTAVTPNELMEPNYTGPNHNMSLALNLMEDIGWGLDPKCDPEPTTVADSDTLTTGAAGLSWDLQVEVTNTGANDAYNVNAVMQNGPGWLIITDANCAYGTIASGGASFGADQYTLDYSAWPGGPFTVDLYVTWQDVCGNPYNQTVTVDLLPMQPTPVGGTPYAYRLESNVPNPFNPSTTIRYEIAGADPVSLRVYDVSGRLVRTLVNQRQSAGAHEARWDGRDERGATVASGVYFYRLRAGEFDQTRRMVLLK